jgi:hypothetical protein
MAENDSPKLPSFKSLDELVEFFETRDLGEYEEDLPEAHFDVDLRKKTHLVAIDEETNNRLTEVAEQEQIPAEALVNSWLKEKLSRYPKEA